MFEYPELVKLALGLLPDKEKKNTEWSALKLLESISKSEGQVDEAWAMVGSDTGSRVLTMNIY